jgi:hypothetical protein
MGVVRLGLVGEVDLSVGERLSHAPPTEIETGRYGRLDRGPSPGHLPALHRHRRVGCRNASRAETKRRVHGGQPAEHAIRDMIDVRAARQKLPSADVHRFVVAVNQACNQRRPPRQRGGRGSRIDNRRTRPYPLLRRWAGAVSGCTIWSTGSRIVKPAGGAVVRLEVSCATERSVDRRAAQRGLG